jgi:hypothetical protein
MNNRLLRVQSVDDPQFAQVEDDVDPRVYGQVLTFLCNSFSPQELKTFEAILTSEKEGNR